MKALLLSLVVLAAAQASFSHETIDREKCTPNPEYAEFNKLKVGDKLVLGFPKDFPLYSTGLNYLEPDTTNLVVSFNRAENNEARILKRRKAYSFKIVEITSGYAEKHPEKGEFTIYEAKSDTGKDYFFACLDTKECPIENLVSSMNESGLMSQVHRDGKQVLSSDMPQPLCSTEEYTVEPVRFESEEAERAQSPVAL